MSEVATDARLTLHEAQQLTGRIKLKVGTIQDNIDALASLVTRAKNGAADEVLGYESWTAYIVDVVGSDPNDLTRDERQKFVGFLADEGMSTRAIASVVGVSNKTVHQDIAASTVTKGNSRPATVTSLDGRERPSTQPSYINTETGEVTSQPQPSQPRRRALSDGFRDASLDLGKVITRIENLVSDDRFARNKQEVARYANDLTRARDALQRVINQMSSTEGYQA
jgi:hypothetical protein